MNRRRVSQVALQHLMAMWTGVSVEIIAKLDATLRTFFSKHNLTKAHEVPSLDQKAQLIGRQGPPDSVLYPNPCPGSVGIMQIARP